LIYYETGRIEKRYEVQRRVENCKNRVVLLGSDFQDDIRERETWKNLLLSHHQVLFGELKEEFLVL